MKEILDFLEELKVNNNREWFAANKDRYLNVKRKVEELTQRLISEVGRVDPEALNLTVADCTYRIYRDTRFSPDKTPYKTHIGIFINPPSGKKSLRCGYYLHIEPGDCLFACGTVCLPSPLVGRIRRSIYDETDEYRDIVESESFRAIFKEIGLNPVKTAPKGFDRNWEYIEYVRPKDPCCSAPLTRKFMLSPDLPSRLAPAIIEAKRYNDFINYTIDEWSESR